MVDKTLIYDLENATLLGRPNANTDKLKVFGCYSYITNKYYCLRDKKEIEKTINAHKIFVGFNNFEYDNTVLYNNGYTKFIDYNEKYGEGKFKFKTNVDLMRIFKNRCSSMKVKKGMLGDLLMRFSLDYISKMIDIVKDDGKILDFDYSLLCKDTWTEEEWQLIKRYTIRDLEITKKMYEWLDKYFESFKHYLHTKDIDNKSYLTNSIATVVYKIFCKLLNLEEKYQHDVDAPKQQGGYVAFPAGSFFEGLIYCLDFNSLYPHIFAMCNLFTPKKGGWKGGGVWNVLGEYDADEMGKKEQLLMKIYKDRIVFKQTGDPREYTLKISLNTAYGLVGNSSFVHLFDAIAQGDCTRIGRQWVKYARTTFAEHGYKILYTDTDSVYFMDPFNDKARMLAVKDKIIKHIKDSVPFPQATFDMGVDDEITHMWFFKPNGTEQKDKDSDSEMDEMDFINKPLGLMKKNYIYIAKVFDKKTKELIDTKVIYKNLGVKKKSTSLLTRHIFREILIPKIKKEKKVKWSKTYFRNLILSLMDDKPELICKRFKVFKASSYKSTSCIQAQISLYYGAGLHFLVKNKKIGVGKSVKYCTMEQFKKNNLRVEDMDLSGVWSELSYFIEREQKVDLSKWW